MLMLVANVTLHLSRLGSLLLHLTFVMFLVSSVVSSAILVWLVLLADLRTESTVLIVPVYLDLSLMCPRARSVLPCARSLR